MASKSGPNRDNRQNPGSTDTNAAGGAKTSEEKVDAVPEDDAHKAEKVTKAGRDDIDPDAGSE